MSDLIRDPAAGAYSPEHVPAPRPAFFARFAAWVSSPAVLAPVGVFVVLRVVTLVAALVFVRDVPAGRPNLLWYDPARGVGNPSGITYEASLPHGSPLADLMSPWRRYDTAWYILIAMEGYRPDTRIVFPPLYPVLIHATMPLTGGNVVLAAVLVSNIFCLASFLLLYQLILRVFGRQEGTRSERAHGLAARTLILLAAFPSGYYLVAGYTESLFLAFTLGAFLAAWDRRWWLAGVCAFLAALTRLQGAILFLPLAWIAYVQHAPTPFDWRSVRQPLSGWVRGWRADVRGFLARLVAVVGAPLGTLAFTQYITLNNLGSSERAYAISWKLDTRPPWAAVITYFERWAQGIVPPHEHNNALVLLIMLLLAAFVLYRSVRVGRGEQVEQGSSICFPFAFALYAGATLFVVMLRYHFGENLEGAQFESVIRYVLVLFPCFIAAAWLLRRQRWLFALLIIVMIAAQFILLDNFIHWRWVA